LKGTGKHEGTGKVGAEREVERTGREGRGGEGRGEKVLADLGFLEG